jgi:hypothetical protein
MAAAVGFLVKYACVAQTTPAQITIARMIPTTT